MRAFFNGNLTAHASALTICPSHFRDTTTMNTKILFTSLSLLLVSGSALAQESESNAEQAPAVNAVECTAPTGTPIIPDGNVASKDELLSAQSAVKSFQNTNLDYLECLDEKKKGLDPELEADAAELAKLDAAEAAAIKMEEKMAEEFNTARKYFMER